MLSITTVTTPAITPAITPADTLQVSNTLGRLLAGWVTDQSWARPLATISLGTTLAAPCLFLLAAVPQLWLLLATCATFGLATGVWVAATPPALIR